jgi:hypothetical protein
MSVPAASLLNWNYSSAALFILHSLLFCRYSATPPASDAAIREFGIIVWGILSYRFPLYSCILLVCSLYVKGSFIGYCRAHRNQDTNKHLLAIDGVKSTADSAFYMGKRVAYIYVSRGIRQQMKWIGVV